MAETILTPTGGGAVSIETGTHAPTSESSFGTSRARLTEAQLREADILFGKALRGNRRAILDVQEAFSTSDFKLAVFANIEKEMLAQYDEYPAAWRDYTSATTVNDFRPKTIIDVMRGRVGLDRVPELSEYPTINKDGAEVGKITVGKFGGRYAISWEAWINDTAVQEIGDIPAWLAANARETEGIIAASNLVSKDGINKEFFKAGNGNAPEKKALTYANLKAALDAVKSRKSRNGRAVIVPGQMRLVVPQALESVAVGIMDAREVRETVGGVETVSTNTIGTRVKLVVDPMLDYVNQSSSAATTWFLLPDPNGPRRAVFLAHLRGHEAPEVRVKADTGQRVGGGAIPARDGSFTIDDIQYRVRHVVGGGTGDGTAAYASDGSAA